MCDLAAWNLVADRLEVAAQTRRAIAASMSTTVPSKSGGEVTVTTAEGALKLKVAEALEGLATDIRHILQEKS